jgi:hypothetical protein
MLSPHPEGGGPNEGEAEILLLQPKDQKDKKRKHASIIAHTFPMAVNRGLSFSTTFGKYILDPHGRPDCHGTPSGRLRRFCRFWGVGRRILLVLGHNMLCPYAKMRDETDVV